MPGSSTKAGRVGFLVTSAALGFLVRQIFIWPSEECPKIRSRDAQDKSLTWHRVLQVATCSLN